MYTPCHAAVGISQGCKGQVCAADARMLQLTLTWSSEPKRKCSHSMRHGCCPCRLLLDSNPPAVLVAALLTASQLARLHRDNYAPLATAAPYPQLRKLLNHSEPAVRARVCNLLGNMCRHSAYFYTALDRHGLLPPLIQRCTDDDRSTRKFACFAIGNAGQLCTCACLWAAASAHPCALSAELDIHLPF